MRTTLVDEGRKKKIVVMVSKFDHALLHLLYQIRVGWLDAEVVAIVSNHEDSRGDRRLRGHPLSTCCRSTSTNKLAQEQEVLRLVKETGAELVVLARYMQILSRHVRDPPVRPDHQHPPLVPAQLQGRKALSPGA